MFDINQPYNFIFYENCPFYVGVQMLMIVTYKNVNGFK